MFITQMRSRGGFFAILFFAIAATGASAATMHRFAVLQETGSGGATAFVQTAPTMSALQGEVGSAANTSIKLPFGVLGEYDAPGSSFGIGVGGVSTTGYGVAAEAFGVNPSMLALNSGTGDGLDVFITSNSSTATGILAQVTGGPAISGTASGANAAMTASNTGTGDGLDTIAFGSGTGVHAVSNGSGPAIIAKAGGTADALDAYIPADSYPTGAAAIFAHSIYANGVLAETDSPLPDSADFEALGGTLFDGIVGGSDEKSYITVKMYSPSNNASGTVVNTVSASSDLNLNGDILISGSVYTDCGNLPITASNCRHNLSSDAIHTSRGETLTTYAARHASATMEDEGEAQLVNGYAHVPLEREFATTISTATPYLVFTTPEGESHGLYVTHKTAEGFDVRENAPGHTSMVFDYRIVAHPFGDRSIRLAQIVPHTSGQRPIAPAAEKAITSSKHSMARTPHSQVTKKTPPDLFQTP